MSELKAITVLNAYQLECNDNDLVYLKSDVDKVIAEKDAEIRRLKHALYKACANWAICKACILEYFCHILDAKKWERMHHKCRAKAEEYENG